MNRLRRPGSRTITTSPDNLPYPGPDDYNDPADVPLALGALANATQAALNKKSPVITTTKINIARVSGWQNNQPTASKTGKLVVLSSHFQRNAPLTAVADTAYTLGTLAGGYRPAAVERFPCAWSDGGVRRTGQVWVWGDGTIEWYPTVNGDLVDGDFVSVSGIVFATP